MEKGIAITKFEAAIIDPALERRAVLRGALRAVNPRIGCHSFNGLEHVFARANSHTPSWDIIFVSDRGEGSLAHIIKSLKKSRLGANAVYIAVVSGRAAISTVANRIAEGFAAVLTEPYSADAVADVTKLALQLQKQQRASYEQRVIRLLVREICDQVDTAAKLRGCGRSARMGMYMLSEMCEVLPTLSAEMRSVYFEELCEITSRGKPFSRRLQDEKQADNSNVVDIPLKRMAGAI